MIHTIISNPHLPDEAERGEWLQSGYAGGSDIRRFRNDEPFPHFFAPNLLKSRIFDEVSKACNAEFSRVVAHFDVDDRRMQYCPLLVTQLVGFFCGPDFRELVSSIMGSPVKRAPGSIPQLRRVIGPAPALSSHSDEGAPFTMASFFSVHGIWPSDAGGELILERGTTPACVITPEPNALYGMAFGPRSFHHVRAMVLPISRMAIYQEWILDA